MHLVEKKYIHLGGKNPKNQNLASKALFQVSLKKRSDSPINQSIYEINPGNVGFFSKCGFIC
jgi:hypothetical protein